MALSRTYDTAFKVDWERDIHKFHIGDLRIVLDVNTGSIHVVDKFIWDVLNALRRCSGDAAKAAAQLQEYPTQEISKAVEELEQLSRQKALFTSDSGLSCWENENLEGSSVIKSLCLNVSHDCNMRCGYCFAGDGKFGGTRRLMPLETAKRAVDFLLKNSGGRRHLEIDFFGGEPLLNKQAVERTVEYGAGRAADFGKKIKFTVTTNGLLLDDAFTRFADRWEMQVVLSLDGRRETHDRVRLLPDGKGSFDRVFPRVQRFTQLHTGSYYVRGTFTRKNMDFSRDVLYLFDAGFKHVSVEPVVAPPEKFGFYDEDVPALEAEYERLAVLLVERIMQGHFIDFFHFNIDLDGGTCIPKRIKGCGAGFEYLAVDPNGGLFPCHQFVGINDFLMGSVVEGFSRDYLTKKFRSAHIYNKRACTQCWARYFCSGGCHANAYIYSGDIMQPFELGCRLQRKRIECGIYFQIKKRLLRQ